MALIPFNQSKFAKLNRRVDPTQLDIGEYALGVNVRVRNGGLEPIALPKEVPLPLFNKLQGVYGADKFLLIFADGKAYYRNYGIDGAQFTEVPDFTLSPDVDTIYACAVPASTINNARIPMTDGDNVVIPSGEIKITVGINSTPACIICQDGQSQPRLIFSNGTSRLAAAYGDWTQDNREYVPIGKQMVFINNKLYVVIKDTNNLYTLIASSITGRPADFMVNIDYAGNKLATEALGGARTTAYSVDYSEISCISIVGSSNGSFFVSTKKNSYLVNPNFDFTIFNEPTYSNQWLFSTGCPNNFSIADILGDTALIDFNGIRSFNAIRQAKFEGRNMPFSADIQPFLGSIVQSVTSAWSWDNYGFFAVQTIHGAGCLIYDTLLQNWVSLDMYDGIGIIKQFADIKTDTAREMFFISGNKLYEWGRGDSVKPSIYIGEFAPQQNALEASNRINTGNTIKPQLLNLTFVDVIESGTVIAECYLDSEKVSTLSSSIVQDEIVDTTLPKSLPFGNADKDKVRPLSFEFPDVPYGYKVGFFVSWDCNAKLLNAGLIADVKTLEQTEKEQARAYDALQSLR